MNLKSLTDQNLLANIKKLSSDERKITTEILHHLREIESRRLHLELGYSSLYAYCTKELKYSDAQAYRRISAMKLIVDMPEVETKIKNGSLTLSNAAKIQTFIRQSNVDKKHISKNEKRSLISRIENKSARECELELIKLSPEPIITKAKERIISEDYTEVKITIKKDLKTKLDKVKSLLSHQNPNGDLNKLLDIMCDMVLKKKDPSLQRKTPFTQLSQAVTEKDQLKQMSPQKSSNPKSRYIPSTVKQEVYMRDKGCCTYTDPKTKRKCTSRHLLQYDHKYPLSLGGETNVKNLRLLCFQHHKLVTENVRAVGL